LERKSWLVRHAYTFRIRNLKHYDFIERTSADPHESVSRSIRFLIYTQENNSLNEHKKNHGNVFQMINMLYFGIMQFCHSNLMYLHWINLMY